MQTMLQQKSRYSVAPSRNALSCTPLAVRPGCTPTPHKRGASCQAVSGSAQITSDDTYQKLKGIKVFQSSTGQEVELVSQWSDSDTVVVAWMRSLGCPFCQELAVQLGRDVSPKLAAKGIRLMMVSIGTPERSKDFVAKTGFPAEDLFVDPDNLTYDAIGLVRTFQNAFLDPRTPLSFVKRAMKSNTKDLQTVLSDWVPWQPPKGVYQALQQGGMYVFEGKKVVFSHKDQATADHVELEEVMKVLAPKLAEDCGCE